MIRKIMGLFCISICAAACISCGVNTSVDTGVSSTAESTPAESISAEPENINEVIERNFDKWFTSDMKNYYSRYFTAEYDQYRKDDLSLWTNEKGQYQYPDGYSIQWAPQVDSVMAAQQFPQSLLEKISTADLYQLILSLPGDWNWDAFDSYLYGLSSYYSRYNFIAELMTREDAADVVHQQYQTYTKSEVEKYSKQADSVAITKKSKLQKKNRFQLAEALEWFYQHAEGEDVPDKQIFGLE